MVTFSCCKYASVQHTNEKEAFRSDYMLIISIILYHELVHVV
jgi:hypothetical protein